MTKKLVEIARSFSYKLNLGNYQTADFFCSQKAEVPENQAEKISEALYEFCKKEVMKSVNRYKAEPNKEQSKKLVKKLAKTSKGKQALKSQADQEIAEGLGGEKEKEQLTKTQKEDLI